MALGTLDRTVGGVAADAMLEASAAQHKSLYMAAHARHEELWLHDPDGLASALDAFIQAAAIE